MNDFIRGQLWEKSGDFNIPAKERHAAQKEYIRLSKPTIDIKEFMKIPIYKGSIKDGEKFRCSIANEIVYTIMCNYGQTMIKSYRIKE